MHRCASLVPRTMSLTTLEAFSSFHYAGANRGRRLLHGKKDATKCKPKSQVASPSCRCKSLEWSNSQLLTFWEVDRFCGEGPIVLPTLCPCLQEDINGSRRPAFPSVIADIFYICIYIYIIYYYIYIIYFQVEVHFQGVAFGLFKSCVGHIGVLTGCKAFVWSSTISKVWSRGHARLAGTLAGPGTARFPRAKRGHHLAHTAVCGWSCPSNTFPASPAKKDFFGCTNNNVASHQVLRPPNNQYNRQSPHPNTWRNLATNHTPRWQHEPACRKMFLVKHGNLHLGSLLRSGSKHGFRYRPWATPRWCEGLVPVWDRVEARQSCHWKFESAGPCARMTQYPPDQLLSQQI